MAHPYSGSASYIYANEYSADDIYPISPKTEWSHVPSSPPLSPQSQIQSQYHRPVLGRPSVPPPSHARDVKMKHYPAYSTSSTVPITNTAPSAFIYESIRVRFDTPIDGSGQWRRWTQAFRRRFCQFRVAFLQAITPGVPSWVTAPSPRLSMLS
ncbi:hypothetical protein B0H34DRAFT_101321 [Crassisporium funariophilum]|nr:hypothetical protein B0H34DRAFT_101321 [Crassisporium funariophilum]